MYWRIKYHELVEETKYELNRKKIVWSEIKILVKIDHTDLLNGREI